MSTETGSPTGTTSPSSSVDLESVRAVAKKDFRDAVRSWLFWGLSVFFFTLLVAVTGFLSYFSQDIAADGLSTDLLVIYVSGITKVIIPLIALVLGWKAIAGERESGSIKILLSLPHSRKDVLLGKVVGRSAVLALSLSIGFALAAAIVAALLGSFDVAQYAGLLAVSIVYGVAYTSLAVSLSSLTRSTTISGAAMVGVFALFYGAWNGITQIARLLANRDVPLFETVSYTTEIQGQEFQVERLPEWVYFLVNLDPGEAYSKALTLATDVDSIELQAQLNAEMFGGELPFFLQDWFSFLILLAWVVVPVLVTLYRFDRVDL